MADDILITIGANVKGVVTAIDKTTRLENSVKKLQKAICDGQEQGRTVVIRHFHSRGHRGRRQRAAEDQLSA